MKWLVALDVLLYIGAVILFFNGQFFSSTRS
jgi:hypothetical protein